MKKKTKKKKTKNNLESMGSVKVVEDFLPSPKELAFREETVKVTIALSRQSVDFFKKQASYHHTPYQKLIRRLLDEYVFRHESRKA